MARVLVTLGSMQPGAAGGVAKLEAAGIELRFRPAHPATPADELVAALDGCDAVFAASESYSDDVLRRAASLRHVARAGVGLDSVDLAAATRHGVAVSTTPGTNDWAVADHAFGLLLSLAHRLVEDDRSVKSGVWRSRFGPAVDVWQKTIGVVGLGRIGKGVARRARGFDMRVLVYEPYPDHEFVQEHGLTLAPLDTVFAESDFVTLHLPMAPETAGFVDAARLALMKPSAYLINTARGGLVDEDALYDALANRRIAGAGLDVRRVEPPADTRFSALDNVILTPHSATNTQESLLACTTMVADNILAVLRGDRPPGLANPDVWGRLRMR